MKYEADDLGRDWDNEDDEDIFNTSEFEFHDRLDDQYGDDA